MLTSIIEHGNQAVKGELGIIPLKSQYSLYNPQDWIGFCINRNGNPKIESLYLPRTYSAHLKDKTDFLDIYLLHEYFGHGLFCEYSKIGQRIVAFEQELVELEKLILDVDKLPVNQKITITSKNPHFYDYKKLRKELGQFCQENYAHYEGFAYWLQYDLSRALDLIEKWDKLKQKLPESYKELFEQVNQFAEKNGKMALLEQLSF